MGLDRDPPRAPFAAPGPAGTQVRLLVARQDPVRGLAAPPVDLIVMRHRWLSRAAGPGGSGRRDSGGAGEARERARSPWLL